MSTVETGNPGVCDSCGKKFAWKPQLAGKTIKCKCGGMIGFEGQASGPPAPSFPGHAGPRGGAKADEEHKKAEIKKMVTIGVAVVLLIGLLIGAKFAFQALHHEEPKNLPGLDARVAHMIKEDGATEVIEWLNGDSKRGVVGYFWVRNRLEGKVKQWYDHGAKKVLAFGSYMTASLAIELPDDKEKRPYFFEYAETFRGESGGLGIPPQTDVGQKYIVLDFMPAPEK